jgi:hypothetical protein
MTNSVIPRLAAADKVSVLSLEGSGEAIALLAGGRAVKQFDCAGLKKRLKSFRNYAEES